MIKVLLMPCHTIKSINEGGVKVYNKSLVELFSLDKNIHIEIFCDLPDDSKFGLKYDQKNLNRKILDYAPDIIHVNGYTSLILKEITQIAQKNNIKVVYTPHWHPFNTMNRPYLKQLYFYLFVKPYLKYVNKIICINKEEHSFFNQFSNNTSLIPHWYRGINTEQLIKRKPNQILFVGRLNDSNKGIEHLLQLPIGKYEIHCVGNGVLPLRPDIIQHTNISNEDLDKLYQESSLLVVPSRYEAFSYVTLEALCTGTPVVVSERVRIKDFLIDDDNCTVFKYGDIDDFIAKIDSTIGKYVNPQQYINLFSKSNAKNKYFNLYSSII